MTLNLDDTSQCPTDNPCWSCGTAADLAVVTLGTSIGIYCLTLCGTCTAAGRFPTGWATTATLVMRHCSHLDIDLDQMAAALDAEAGQ